MTQQQERVERFSRELSERPVSDRSMGEILNSLRPQAQELANKQVELPRAELAPLGKQVGIAVGLLAVGALFLLLFLVFLFLTGMYIMQAVGFPLWVAAGIDTVILLLIGAILAGLGAARLRTLDPKPRRTMIALRQNIDWLKGQLRP